MKTLRYLLFEECNRRCKGCCNKDWDLAALPDEQNFGQYDEIMLTGGEPMLRPGMIISTVERIRRTAPETPIYLYTAKVDDLEEVLHVVQHVNGITVTLHNRRDVQPFLRLDACMELQGLSLRVNVFKGVTLHVEALRLPWKVKSDIEWIKECPLPSNETFKRCR